MYQEETQVLMRLYIEGELYEEDTFTLLDMDILPDFYHSARAIYEAIEQFAEGWSDSFYDSWFEYDSGEQLNEQSIITFVVTPLKERRSLAKKRVLLEQLGETTQLLENEEYFTNYIKKRYNEWLDQIVRFEWRIQK